MDEDKLSKLERLSQLYLQGLLNKEEFEQQKAEIINAGQNRPKIIIENGPTSSMSGCLGVLGVIMLIALALAAIAIINGLLEDNPPKTKQKIRKPHLEALFTKL